MRSFLPAFLCLGLYLSAPDIELSAQRKKTKTPAYNYLSKTKTMEEIQALTNKTEKVYHMLCGEFNNKAQADTSKSPKLPCLRTSQQIIAVPVWQEERKGEYWLYYGWFAFGEPQKALAQGLFKITPEKDQSDNVKYKLSFYTLANEEEHNFYSEEWKKEKPFAGLKPRDLLHDEGCVTYVVESEEHKNEFLFEAAPNSMCHWVVSDILHYCAFAGKLTPQAQHYYTTFYDAKKTEVFSYPRPQGFTLLRQDKNKPMYAPIQPVKK